MMAFVEGERYLADAVVDHLSFLNMEGSYDGFISNPAAIWAADEPRSTLQNVPSTPTYGFTHIRHRQERSFGWSQYSWDTMYALIADDDRHLPFLLNLQQNTSDLLEDSIAFFPASQLETGSYWIRNPPQIATFMNGLTSQLFQRSNILTENAYPGYVQMLNLLVRYLRDTLIFHPYASRFDHQFAVTGRGQCDPVCRSRRTLRRSPGHDRQFRRTRHDLHRQQCLLPADPAGRRRPRLYQRPDRQ